MPAPRADDAVEQPAAVAGPEQRVVGAVLALALQQQAPGNGGAVARRVDEAGIVVTQRLEAADLAGRGELDEDIRSRFGTEAMDVLVGWTKNLCSSKDLPGCSVLDIGTGSGRLLQQLAKQGFSDLTGIDYSEAAIELVRNLAIRDGFEHINFLVDDVLESKLDRRSELVMDEGTLDKRIDPKDPDAEDTPAEDDVESLLKKLGMDVETEYSSG
ncbi:hypothetical protein ZWY2020_003584 [Hordeum vulgare]|nr:hypothetical protein ZWY2020_003584 [Hordeum vulgare]